MAHRRPLMELWECVTEECRASGVVESSYARMGLTARAQALSTAACASYDALAARVSGLDLPAWTAAGFDLAASARLLPEAAEAVGRHGGTSLPTEDLVRLTESACDLSSALGRWPRLGQVVEAALGADSVRSAFTEACSLLSERVSPVRLALESAHLDAYGPHPR